MPIYNNPAIGQAFENIASMFAPPSGSDLSGYANARNTNLKSDAYAKAIAAYGDPNATLDQRDSAGILAGLFAPTQSYHAVDIDDATKRYGVDVGATTARRGQDIAANTTLQTSAMDNQRSAITSLYGALDQGQIRPAIPAEIANKVGLPAIAEVAGAAKPLSETEWMAGQNERLRQSGKLPDNMLLDALAGKETPVQVVGPAGKPQYSSPGAAVRAGAEPYNATAEKSLVEGTALLDGKSVQVFRSPTESVYRTADGRQLPPDVQVFERAKPTGTNEQLGMKPSEFTTKNGMFGVRADAANAEMNKLLKAGYQPGAIDFEMSAGVGHNSLPVSVSNKAMSAEGRQFFNASDNFILSIARPDTGAAISNEEQAAFRRIYIPLPGDDPDTVQNKQQAREIAAAALSANSAGAAEQTLRYLSAHNVPVPDELRNRLEQIRSGSAGPAPVVQPESSGDPLAAAREAIAKGADREKVIQRLQMHGIVTEGL